jgi:transcriptional regulator with XRE-family HTH domain
MTRGRRPGVSTAEKEFRKQFAEALAKAIGTGRGAQSRAAEALGVKKQLISLYLKGETSPSREFVRRASELWGFSLDFGGMPVGPESFPLRPRPRIEPQQLELFSDDKQLKVVVLRRSVDSVELSVSMNFKQPG